MLVTRKILPALQLILAVAITLLPFVLMPVCGPLPNGMFMACHDSAIWATGGGVLLLLLAIFQGTWKGKPGLLKLVAVLQLVVAALLYAVPHRILPLSFRMGMKGKPVIAGICGKEGMPCIHTFATLSWVLVAVALVALLYLGLQFTQRREA